jgi:hypothetical protein
MAERFDPTTFLAVPTLAGRRCMPRVIAIRRRRVDGVFSTARGVMVGVAMGAAIWIAGWALIGALLTR